MGQQLPLRGDAVLQQVLLVAVYKLPFQHLGGQPPYGGLAAARHPDEHQVPPFGQQLPVNPQHRFFARHRHPKGVLGSSGLGRQHQQPAARGDAQFRRLLAQPGPQGIVDHIRHPLAARELPQIQRRNPALRGHAHRRGVDEIKIPFAKPFGQILIVQLSGAAHGGNFGRPQLLRSRFGRMAGTAAPQDDHRLAGQHPAILPQQEFQPRKVGIIAGQGAVPALYQQVDAAAALGRRGQLGAIGQHLPFVGDSHIDGGKIPGRHKRFKLCFRQRTEFIFHPGQPPVQLRGNAVAQRPSD